MKTIIALAAILGVASAAYQPFGQQPARHVQPQQYHPQQYSHSGNEIPILRQASDIHPDGSYSYSYETGNGISAAESGVGGQVANGNAQWTAPDGTPVQLAYVADENGFQPTGSHIPVAPPVPEPILRALEYIRTHPSQEDSPQQYYKQAKPSYQPKAPVNPFQRQYQG